MVKVTQNGKYNNIRLSDMGVDEVITVEKMYEEGKMFTRTFDEAEGPKNSYLVGMKYDGVNVSTFFSEPQYEKYKQIPLGMMTITKVKDGKKVWYEFAEAGAESSSSPTLSLTSQQLGAVKLYVEQNKNKDYVIKVSGVETTIGKFLPQEVLNNPEMYC
jgi:hypothetical protein